MSCNNCSTLHKLIRNIQGVSGAGVYPSTLELAYMVNLEYYTDITYSCVHKIPEDGKAVIKIKEMVDFLDSKNWQLGIRTNYNGFKCSSFLNHPAKQLVIIHRGTQNWEHVKADILLALNIITKELIHNADWHTYQSLMNNALKEENQKFVRNEYSVTITGHSLGGWLAQMCTLISKYPKYHPVGPRGVLNFPNGKSIDMDQPYDLHCVVFDSPGASTMLERLEKVSTRLVGREKDMENALNNLDITVYLSNPNLVNMCGQHVGKVERIDVMSGCSNWQKLNPIASHSMEKILTYFKNQ